MQKNFIPQSLLEFNLFQSEKFWYEISLELDEHALQITLSSTLVYLHKIVCGVDFCGGCISILVCLKLPASTWCFLNSG